VFSGAPLRAREKARRFLASPAKYGYVRFEKRLDSILNIGYTIVNGREWPDNQEKQR